MQLVSDEYIEFWFDEVWDGSLDWDEANLRKLPKHGLESSEVESLWERSLEKPQVVARPVAHGKPSLVASYETSGKLDLELELAHAAKQPFKV